MTTAHAPLPTALRKLGDTSAPRDAMQLAAGLLEFAEPNAATPGEAPIKMLARTPQPITHWYWGRCVHDMAGMQLRKATCPIDWCHDSGEILGVLDQFKATPKSGLEVSGKLISFREDDRAAELIHKGRAGIPYEASLDFTGPGLLVEEVGEGTKVKVNGYTFVGPGVIFRQWSLRSVAVCPYGADSGARSSFTDGEPEEISISLFSEDTTVPPKTDAAPPEQATQQTKEASGTPAGATQQQEQPTKPAAPPAADAPKMFSAADLAKFTAKFGGENGAKWLSEGKSYEAALELHAEALAAQLKAKDGEIAAANAKLAAAKTGEESPATFADGEKPGSKTQHALDNKIGPNLARFAAGMNLPGAKK